jgi:hypothetical protein
VRFGFALSLACLSVGCTTNELGRDGADASAVSEASPTAAPSVASDPLVSLPEPSASTPPRATEVITVCESSAVEPSSTAPESLSNGEPAIEPPPPLDPYPSEPPPPGARCHEVLDALGVAYRVAPMEPGIVDPILVSSPLRGVRFRYVHSHRAEPLVLDCRFTIGLARAMDVLRAHGVDEFQHVGAYNYRCIGPGTPPDCRLSQHAIGMALDFVGFTIGERTHSVLREFRVKAHLDATPTCALPRVAEGDALIKDVVCAWWDVGAFRVLLTPNYNEAHHDHVHVDLAEGTAPGPGFTLEGPTAGVDPPGRKHGE